MVPSELDPAFGQVLVDVAREAKLVGLDDPARLAPLVQALAAIYNDDRLTGLRASPKERLAARLGFWLPRDVPKVEGAVREAIAIGRIRLRDEPLRVLDVGAGLGASHRGLARALAAAGQTGTIDVLAIDDDREALRLAAAVHARRPREGAVEIRLRVEPGNAAEVATAARTKNDVILLGQVLSELDLDRTPEERVELHAERIAAIVRERLAPRGVLVIVEPALRSRTRHLQAVRSALIARGLSILAPCLHHGRCPLLGREGDWCHEDLPVDLPPFLVPIAKRAGLRWEGLTFSYLVVVQRGPRLVDALPSAPNRVRAVSSLLVTKGKTEVVVCGDPLRGEVPDDDPLGPHGARIGRLDRARADANRALDAIGRGDVVTVGALDEKLRLGKETPLEVLQTVEPERPDTAS